MAWTPGCTGRGWARRPWPNWCCAACCRWPARACAAGVSIRAPPTACWASSSSAASPAGTARVWQIATTRAISEQTGADRAEALRQMTQRYIELMHGNEPVHTWPGFG